MTKLTSALPQGESNGLGTIAHDLVEHPHKLHIAVVVLDCKSVTVDNDSGATIPTARIRRIEPIGPQDRELAVQMMRRALETRTGQAVLPIDLEDEISAIFAGIDPETGELLEEPDDGGDDE